MDDPKKLLRALIALTVLMAIAAVLLYLRGRADKPIDKRPAALTATIMLVDNYAFRQDDENWGAQTIGRTTDSMRAYGCTISSVAMAASNLTGASITPGQLVKRLTEANGFTNRGWLIWDRLPAATDGRISARLYNQPDHRHIERCMDEGHYPIVKFKLGGTIIHWALVVGATEGDYLIRDPLSGGPDDGPIPLSSRTEEIQSIRCIVDNS